MVERQFLYQITNLVNLCDAAWEMRIMWWNKQSYERVAHPQRLQKSDGHHFCLVKPIFDSISQQYTWCFLLPVLKTTFRYLRCCLGYTVFISSVLYYSIFNIQVKAEGIYFILKEKVYMTRCHFITCTYFLTK